jgi:UDP-N-acetylmuramate dehydrogenase
MRLAALTTLGLGGPADRIVTVETQDELIAAVAEDPELVLAGGSNVVIADEGVAGTVVLIRTSGVERDGNRLVVQAGEPWDAVVAYAVEQGLAGIECLSGIPGSTGATPIQNVGAYGQDVSETIEWVRVYDRETRAVDTLDAAACRFGYRSSRFKYRQRWTVLAVAFRLNESRFSRCGGPRAWSSIPATRTASAPAPSSRTRSSIRPSTHPYRTAPRVGRSPTDGSRRRRRG